MDLDKALQLIHGKRAILFTGSGFSFGATSQRKDEDGNFLPFRSANEISKELANQCGVEDEGLSISSEVFIQQKSDRELILFLNKEFTLSSISESHMEIGKIDWMRQYTTNYDEVLEESARRAGKVITPVTLDSNPSNYKDKKNVCVHLNGYIGNLTPATLDNEFKLTNVSYNRESISSTEWHGMFLDDLYSCDVIIFIGFSGKYDLDITRDLMSLKNLREKSIFIVGEKEKSSSILILKKYGNVLNIGLDGFLRAWNETPAPPVEPERIFKCFKKLAPAGVVSKIEASHITKLLWRGNYDESLIQEAFDNYTRYPYIIVRDKINEIMEDIDKGHRTFIIKSGLGNGKSIFLNQLAYSLYKSGWDIWNLSNDTSTVNIEIEDICQYKSRNAIIIDNSGDRIHLLSTLKRHRSDDTLVIMAERSARVEVSFEKYYDLDPDMCEIEIDIMSAKELDFAIDYFNRHGLWGDKAGLTYTEKESFIKKKCNCQLGKCIIGLTDENKIREEYGKLIEGIRNKEKYYRLVLYILCAHEYGFVLDYSDLWDVLGTAALNNTQVRNDPAMKEIIDFDSECISFNSSILADHILRNHVGSIEIVDFIGDIFEILEKRKGKSKKIKNQLRTLMQYRTLSKITHDNAAIFTFYERLSALPYCQAQPHFWLQYGIAKTSNSDFQTARKYFETAYSLANTIGGYDTYQIDNHHAHMLLREALASHTIEQPMKLFREIHSKLVKRKKGDEQRHYIYRVAQDYPKFWNRIHNSLSPEDKVEFKLACKEIIDFGKKYISLRSVSKTKMVKEVLDNLKTILES